MFGWREKERSRFYNVEGYLLKWNRRGMIIDTTDYHATTLQVSWDEIFEMAAEVKQFPRRRESNRGW